MPSPTLSAIHELAIEIGEMPILVRTDSAEFAHLIGDRYGEFVAADASHSVMELEIRLVGTRYGIRNTGLGTRDSDLGLRTPDSDEYDQALSVRRESGRWVMERGDFRAEWDPQCRRGWVRQTANPYAIDGVLRILHSLILAREGGFLVHAASAIRKGQAFVFAGVSGTGKTTISRLAPPDVTLLTDEISYVRAEEQVSGARCQVSGVRSQEPGAGSQESEAMSPKYDIRGPRSKSQIPSSEPQIANRQSQIANRQSTIDNRQSYAAFGTPFAGELARIGKKVRAPLATLFLLQQGPENRIEPVSESQAVRELMRHVLFFAQDEELVRMIFRTVCDFVGRVPVRRLVFTKDARVWELIG